MNLNTGFQPQYPMNYNQMYQQPQRNNGIIWVQGKEGAKAYQLMPNSNAVLMDSDVDGVFYIKVSDNVGMCTLRKFKFTEITNEETAPVDVSNYITRDEFNKAIQELKGVTANAKSTIQPTSNTATLLSER